MLLCHLGTLHSGGVDEEQEFLSLVILKSVGLCNVYIKETRIINRLLPPLLYLIAQTCQPVPSVVLFLKRYDASLQSGQNRFFHATFHSFNLQNIRA